MNPVLHKISEQRQYTHGERPEVADDDSSECAIFGGEQFARHYKACHRYALTKKCKGKVFTYSLPSAGPGADPGVQAVSPQVT